MRVLIDSSIPDSALFTSVYGPIELPASSDPSRPFVAVDMAMTLDGKVVAGPPNQSLSGSRGDRRVLEELRAAADVVVMGAGTIRAGDPRLCIRSLDLLAARSRRGQAQQPVCLVVTRSGDLDPSARIFTRHPGRTVIATTLAGELSLRPRLSDRVRIAAFGDDQVAPAAVLEYTAQTLGARWLLLEGGPTLTASFIRARCVDQLFVTVAPTIRGGRDVLTLVEGDPWPLGLLPHLQLLEAREDQSELYLRYSIER